MIETLAATTALETVMLAILAVLVLGLASVLRALL